MKIGGDLAYLSFSQCTQAQTPARHSGSGINIGISQQTQKISGSGVVVDISPQGWAAYAQSKTQPAREGQKTNPTTNPTECKTCQSRRYVDVSDDPSVSFQSPTYISPGQAAASVSAHEGEHVSNEKAKADQEGREIVSQTVTLKTSICPECKRVYVSGGETRTVSRPKSQPDKTE